MRHRNLDSFRRSLAGLALVLAACSGEAESGGGLTADNQTGTGSNPDATSAGIAGGNAASVSGDTAAGVSNGLGGGTGVSSGTVTDGDPGGAAGVNVSTSSNGGNGAPSGGATTVDSGSLAMGGTGVDVSGGLGGASGVAAGGVSSANSGGTGGSSTGVVLSGGAGGDGSVESAGASGTDTGGSAASGGTSGGGANSGGAMNSGTDGVVGEPIGFATLNGGTTGGQAGQTVTASTFDQLRSYAESSDPYVIRVEGTIGNGANGGRINVASNKSIVGVGSTAFLNGVGLNINGGSNIIVQNLRVSLIGVTTRTDADGVYSSTGDEGLAQILVNGGDAISISGTSKNIWIDHCELFSEDPDAQTNHDLYDGLVDIKGETGFITLSWNYLHDHHKAGLVGSSDSDIYSDRKVTLHHNYYDNVKLRIPMYRGATGHFFNNYVVGATDASEIRAGTCVRVERNYYEALHYSIYTPSDSPGSTERIENIEVDRTSRAYPSNCSADIPYSYSEVLTSTTEDVKTVVPQLAGVGKL